MGELLLHNIGMSSKKKKKKKKTNYFCFIDYVKTFDCVDHNKVCEKFFRRYEYQTTLPVSWEISIWVKKQQLESYTEQVTISKLGKEYKNVVYCHPVY